MSNFIFEEFTYIIILVYMLVNLIFDITKLLLIDKLKIYRIIYKYKNTARSYDLAVLIFIPNRQKIERKETYILRE